jgi:hypothetical protein
MRDRTPAPTLTSVTLPSHPAPQATPQMLYHTPGVTNCNIALLLLVIDKRLPFFTVTSVTLVPHPAPQATPQMLHHTSAVTNCNKLQHSLFLALLSRKRFANDIIGMVLLAALVLVALPFSHYNGT